MLNTVSELSGALLYPGVPTCPQTPAKVQPSSPYPKALGGSWCASSSMVRTPLSPCFGDTRVPSPVEAAASCSPCLVWSHERQGAVQRAPGRQRWENWEGTAPLAKAGQPGWARLACPPRAGASPSLGTHASSSLCSFLGEWADREAAAQSLHSRPSPAELQLPGEAPGPRWAAAATCARATSQPWEPLPGTSFAFPTNSQPLLGAKQLPMTLPPAATALAASRSLCKRESTWHAKGDSGCRGHGMSAGSGCVCSPRPLLGSRLCELLCGFPLQH